MRALLFFILLTSCFYFIEAHSEPNQPPEMQELEIQPQAQPTLEAEPEPQHQPQPEQKQIEPEQEAQKQVEQPKSSVVKNIFSFGNSAGKDKKPYKSNSDENGLEPRETKPFQTQIVDIDQLQKIIDSFPEDDRRTIKAVKVQIATWPKEIFDEISAYREFVISSRRVAKQKYSLLSQEAKSALETERQLKQKLSPDTARTLENLEVRNN
jgi:hypothetical protein